MNRSVAVLMLVATLTATSACSHDGSERSISTIDAAASATVTTRPATPGSDVHRVLLLGDGTMWDSLPAFEAMLATAQPPLETVRSETYWGFALARRDIRDWKTLWPQYVAETDPDLIVIALGAHDIERNPSPYGEIDATNADWPFWYGGLVGEAVSMLRQRRAVPIVWIAMQPQGPPEIDARVAIFNQTLIDRQDSWPITIVDPSLSPAATNPPVHKADGLHLCAAGAQRFAESVEPVLASAGIAIDTAWVDGDWRRDGRYSLDAPAGCSG